MLFRSINAGKLLEKDKDYTLEYTENSTFTVAFTKEYIQKLVNSSKEERTVTVKYSAVVLDSAVTQVGENKATLEFSRTPEETDTKARNPPHNSFPIAPPRHKPERAGRLSEAKGQVLWKSVFSWVSFNR